MTTQHVSVTVNGSAEEFDYLVIAAGRGPDVEGLGLDEAGIEVDERGLVKVDGRLRTSREGVWAIGDMVPGPALAHKASDEGIIAVEDAAFRHQQQFLAEETLQRIGMQGNSAAAEVPNLPHNSGVDLVEEYLDDDAEGGVISVAAAEDFSGLDAGDIHGPVDGLSAAVNEDGPHSDRFHEDDVLQRGVQGVGIFHGAAAQLDHCKAITKGADVTQRLDQSFSLAYRGIHRC